ncbi:MAG: hypothetical protein ACKVS8_05250 [Phycisphaerales bacterium]
MTFRGHIENGRVTLETGTILPEGANVRVEVVRGTKTGAVAKPSARKKVAGLPGLLKFAGSVPGLPRARAGSKTKRKVPRTLYERYKPIVGSVRGLPSDLSVNHDHYLYGTPKVRP